MFRIFVRRYSAFPRVVKATLKLPLILGTGAAGAATFVSVKLEEFKKSIPDWLKFDNKPAIEAKSADTKEPEPDKQLVVLTRKLFEIRKLLKQVGSTDDQLQLPAIVVIGSQSSGKSSVLESIVGQTFLPKGKNMVTRRPIELELVYSPETSTFAEFKQLKLGKISDFSKVSQVLTDLNRAVSEEECVSEDPIELTIYSPNVPDLTLIDLPGYIQIHSKNQPPILKQKIQNLVEKFIKDKNIILAVCASDVDLANSEALNACKRVDPLGKRTIGVLTKMDLVSPETGRHLLLCNDYPLELGYVGVVQSGDDYFSNEFKGLAVGHSVLRERLVQVLGNRLKSSVESIKAAVQNQLQKTNYEFKVEFNDRETSAAAYMSETLDSLKQNFKHFEKEFGKEQVRNACRREFSLKILQLCQEWWDDPEICQCSTNDKFAQKIDEALFRLTRSGVGKMTTDLVKDELQEKLYEMTSTEAFTHHNDMRNKIISMGKEIIGKKYQTTVDQVENTIKPFKFEVELSKSDWMDATKRAEQILTSEIERNTSLLKELQQKHGKRKLRSAIQRIQSNTSDTSATSVFWFLSPRKPQNLGNINEPALQAIELQAKIKQLSHRLDVVRSRACSNMEMKRCCPEIYLTAVSEKLVYTSVLFIWIELLNEFMFQMPRSIDSKLFYGMNQEQVRQFALENPRVAKHLSIQKQKETLELVFDKLRSLE